jgi:hypothetical protein
MRIRAPTLCIRDLHAAANDGLWDLLRAGRQVVLIRHTLTDPGVGDPQARLRADLY